jgi:thiol-disulfide isomerase/thioredoxin
MDKSTSITIVVIFGILILGGVYTYLVQNNVRVSERDTEASRTLSAAEETPYTDLEGNPFSFDDFRGQVRVVNSWASWCPFCTQELEDFERLAAEYRDQNVAVIAINRKEPRERAVQFLSTLGKFTETHFAIDLTDAYYISIGGFSMPETVFYDTEGNVVFHKRGFMDMAEMRKHTEAALTALDN